MTLTSTSAPSRVTSMPNLPPWLVYLPTKASWRRSTGGSASHRRRAGGRRTGLGHRGVGRCRPAMETMVGWLPAAAPSAKVVRSAPAIPGFCHHGRGTLPVEHDVVLRAAWSGNAVVLHRVATGFFGGFDHPGRMVRASGRPKRFPSRPSWRTARWRWSPCRRWSPGQARLPPTRVSLKGSAWCRRPAHHSSSSTQAPRRHGSGCRTLHRCRAASASNTRLSTLPGIRRRPNLGHAFHQRAKRNDAFRRSCGGTLSERTVPGPSSRWRRSRQPGSSGGSFVQAQQAADVDEVIAPQRSRRRRDGGASSGRPFWADSAGNWLKLPDAAVADMPGQAAAAMLFISGLDGRAGMRQVAWKCRCRQGCHQRGGKPKP